MSDEPLFGIIWDLCRFVFLIVIAGAILWSLAASVDTNQRMREAAETPRVEQVEPTASGR